MAKQVLSFWLEGPNGTRLRIGSSGLLIGRSAFCDVQLWDSRVSNQHALLRHTPDGSVMLFPLGRNVTLLNGKPARRACTVSPGDRLRLPGLEFTLVRQGRAPAPGVTWNLKRPDSAFLFRLPLQGLTLGGDEQADVHIPGWPAQAVQAEIVQAGLLLSCAVPADHDGMAVEAQSMIEVAPGSTLTIDGVPVRFFRSQKTAAATTVVGPESRLPSAVRCEFLPSGGILQLQFGEQWTSVELSELRFSLIAALLRPGRGLQVGDFIPDDIVIPGIWPSRPEKGHTDLNLLLHRVRKNLLKAGINPFQVLERSKKGGYATRFRVQEGAQVSII